MKYVSSKENLTKGIRGEGKFTRSENEFTPSEVIWKS